MLARLLPVEGREAAVFVLATVELVVVRISLSSFVADSMMSSKLAGTPDGSGRIGGAFLRGDRFFLFLLSFSVESSSAGVTVLVRYAPIERGFDGCA